MSAPAWYAHGYAVWTGAALAAAGGWVAWGGARLWPGALWRRLRGVAFIPGELAGAHARILVGLLIVLAGGAAVGVEWGLRGFQSYEGPALAGRIEIQLGVGRVSAAWTDPFGRSTHTWSPACTRLTLVGEFVDWSRLAHTLGFRDRHRVTGGRLSCPPDRLTTERADSARLRPPSRTWEALQRWDRWLPLLRAEERESPALQVASGSWRVFVMPGGYAFSE